MKTRMFASLAIALIAVFGWTLGAFAQGPQPGRGGSRGQAQGYNLPPATGGTLDAQTTGALVDALNDEYHARAYYEAVIAKFGASTPFSNIMQAESQHIETVKLLLTRYNVPIPADTFTGKVTAPATLQEAIQGAVDAKKGNVAMYDRFLAFVTQEDVKTIFIQLREVSQTRHLTALERALRGNYAGGIGLGRGGRWTNDTTTAPPQTPQTDWWQRLFGRWSR
jgi:hypothetical protein